jgi:diguanylate cyclase (GGDEF)-like protein
MLGWVDYVTGYEISFAFFYLLPVSLAAWTLSRMAGLINSVVCAAVWSFANHLAGEAFSSPLIPYWNAVTRLGFFFVVTLLLAEIRHLLEQERRLARTDFLTGVLNNRAFHSLADLEIARARRYQHPFTLLYIDLDNFKTVNDQLGHHVGDALLQSVAHTIVQTLRSIDAVARLGGDEFVVLLPETNQYQAQVIAPRLQTVLLAAMANHHWPVTFSIGALTCCQTPSDSQTLIRCADQLMYKVKHAGKNAICYSEFAG